jgi:hypothetical protein
VSLLVEVAVLQKSAHRSKVPLVLKKHGLSRSLRPEMRVVCKKLHRNRVMSQKITYRVIRFIRVIRVIMVTRVIRVIDQQK